VTRASSNEHLLEVTSVLQDDELAVLEVAGELDLSTAGRLHEELLKSLADEADLLVDLTQVSFIDSSGIATLVGAFRSLNGNGGMSVLIASGSQVARVFELARMGEVLPIFTDRPTAVSGLTGPAAGD
jgi:anti-sigma B factor antagonist